MVSDAAKRFRDYTVVKGVDACFLSFAYAGRANPLFHPSLYGVQVIKDIPYGLLGERANRLNIYRPTQSGRSWPVLLYIHGGGFRSLSKQLNQLLALQYAKMGFAVVSIDYRLVPKHPFPAAAVDACAAYAWLQEHAHLYGMDIDRLVVAGESAGGNLDMGLAIAACYQRSEPWAKAVYETGIVPKAVISACGMLQISDPERLLKQRHVRKFLLPAIEVVRDAYLASSQLKDTPTMDLVDPLCFLERVPPPH